MFITFKAPRAPPSTPSRGPNPADRHVDAEELYNILLGILRQAEVSKIPSAHSIICLKGSTLTQTPPTEARAFTTGKIKQPYKKTMK
ncbi:hypothetical protein RUND412_004392, partial [Rhizina undulata]